MHLSYLKLTKKQKQTRYQISLRRHIITSVSILLNNFHKQLTLSCLVNAAKENDIRSIILTTVVGTGIVVVTLLALCTNYFRRLKQKQGKFSHSIMIFNCSCSFVTNLYIAENYWKMLRMRSKLRLQFRCRDFKIIYTATAIAIAVTLQTFILRKNTRKCSRCYRNFDFVAGTSKSFIYCYHNCDFRYATNLYNATKCSQCDQNCYFVGETSKSFVMRL